MISVACLVAALMHLKDLWGRISGFAEGTADLPPADVNTVSRESLIYAVVAFAGYCILLCIFYTAAQFECSLSQPPCSYRCFNVLTSYMSFLAGNCTLLLVAILTTILQWCQFNIRFAPAIGVWLALPILGRAGVGQ